MRGGHLKRTSAGFQSPLTSLRRHDGAILWETKEPRVGLERGVAGWGLAAVPDEGARIMEREAYGSATAAPAMNTDDHAFIQSLRAGDEAAFASLLEQYHTTLVRVAMLYVVDRTAAEEVAQETWLGVLKGLDRFEGRSSLKTWILRILTNCARTRGQRDRRSIPFSALGDGHGESAGPSVDPSRFRPADDPVAPHHWSSAPRG
jgi:sigma-70-like protein